MGELLAAAEARTAERTRVMAERAASERARQEREHAAARAKYLDQLAAREQEVWDQVTQLIQTKQPNNYDRAVSRLVDLRDLAAGGGERENSKPPWINSAKSIQKSQVFFSVSRKRDCKGNQAADHRPSGPIVFSSPPSTTYPIALYPFKCLSNNQAFVP